MIMRGVWSRQGDVDAIRTLLLTYTMSAQLVVSQGKNPSIHSPTTTPKDVVTPRDSLRLLTRPVLGHIWSLCVSYDSHEIGDTHTHIYNNNNKHGLVHSSKGVSHVFLLLLHIYNSHKYMYKLVEAE